MALKIRSKDECKWDIVSLVEVMLRLDPGDKRIHTTRSFEVWEGGGEYNVARGLKRCFGLDPAVVTALADNPIGRLVQDLSYQGGVDQSHVKWVKYDGVGRTVRNGMNFTERGAAKKYVGQFVQMKEIGRDLKDASLFFIKCCDFAAAAMQHPVPFEPKNMGGVINTSANEYYPTMSIDGKLFLFTRSDNKLQGKLSQEDFYISEKKGDSWQTAMEAGSPLNTDQNEGAASMSADGKILFFTACNRPDGKGSCDIQFARKTTNGWSSPRNIGEPINTSAWETQPSFSADGKSLYFIRGVYDSNGKRQQDIYVSTLGDDGKFQQPTKLSNVINTDNSEESVFIHPDNRTLYFSSNGHIGMGGLDIYMSKKNEDGTWQTPVNLGYPINTSKDENSLMISPDGM